MTGRRLGRRAVFAPVATRPKLLVVFLRGGMDGLSAVPPLGDADYAAARPTIGVPDSSALALDDRFGLHPALAPLHELFSDGSLAVVHAVGNGTESRSHFQAQAEVEMGPTMQDDGWITRLLAAMPARSAEATSVRAVALSTVAPASVRACTICVTTPSVVGFGLRGALAGQDDAVRALYPDDHRLASAAHRGLDAVRVLSTIAVEPQSTPWIEAAAILSADVGVDVVSVDAGGWDTHREMGAATATDGQMHTLLAGLGSGLTSFWNAAAGIDATAVVLTEFGRRVAENGSGGTDHGSAQAMFVLGRGLAGGGSVIADWPGLAPDALVRGDLAATVDYRSVLDEIVTRRLGVAAGAVFPGFAATSVGVA
jgi:uncharacterized protein (DUF1501 family)